MKFKQLRRRLMESFAGDPKVGPMDGDNGVDYNSNLGDLTEKSIEKINAFLGGTAARSYIDPVVAMTQIYRKLQNIGLHFEYKNTDIPDGETQFPLSYLGGSYGRDPLSGYDPTYDDGIKRKYGYSLSLAVTKGKTDSGLNTISARIVKSDGQENPVREHADPLTESLDVELRDGGEVVYMGNTTHNHALIAKGMDPALYTALWQSMMPVKKLAPILKRAIRELEKNGDQYNSLYDGTWGSVKHFLDFLKELYAACIQNPRATYRGYS